MKRFWKVIGIAVLVGLVGVLLAGAVAFAQDDDGTDWPFDFRQRLHEAIADVLGISVEEYDVAVDTAREQVLDEAVDEGWLTEEQAERMEERAGEGWGAHMRGGFLGGRGRGGAKGGFLGWEDGSLLDIAADQLGMTQEDLVAELQDGSTIADLAAEKGVELQAIADAFVAQRAEDLAEAVEEGRITQERADWMLEQMGEQVLEHLESGLPFDGCGPRGGFGPGRMRPGGQPALPGESES